MNLKLDSASPIPIYLQIVEQIRHGIAASVLVPEEELPSVRVLASRYLINPNTVARAYLELEREGLVSKKRGSGTYVSSQAGSLGMQDRFRIVEQLIDKALSAADEFGLRADEVRRAFERRLQRQLVENTVTDPEKQT